MSFAHVCERRTTHWFVPNEFHTANPLLNNTVHNFKHPAVSLRLRLCRNARYKSLAASTALSKQLNEGRLRCDRSYWGRLYVVVASPIQSGRALASTVKIVCIVLKPLDVGLRKPAASSFPVCTFFQIGGSPRLAKARVPIFGRGNLLLDLLCEPWGDVGGSHSCAELLTFLSVHYLTEALVIHLFKRNSTS